MFRLVLCATAAVLTLGSVAHAGHIDLTGSAGATVAATGKINDSDVGTVRFEAGPGKSVITHVYGDGLGIDCVDKFCGKDNPYQIDSPETLTIKFDSSVFVKSIDISNLVYENWFIAYYPEYGYGLSDTWHLFTFDASDATNGGLTVDLGFTASKLTLWAGSAKNVDYSVAGLTVARNPHGGPSPSSPIPEPSAALAFGLGAMVLSLFTRRV